jgi:hypothetical protein
MENGVLRGTDRLETGMTGRIARSKGTELMIDSDYSDLLPSGLRIPTVFACRDESGQALRFFCRFCGRYHSHGRHPDEPVGASDGHRVAHCFVEDSPYLDTGYFIVELPDELPVLNHMKVRARYTRDGGLVSGFLAAIRRARASRR